MSQRKLPIYLISVLLFMLILPAGFVLYQWQISKLRPDWQLTGKWLIFWAIGIRLLLAGLRQVTKPAFTAKEIFHMNSEESYVVIRELGFANLCFGTLGVLSLFKPEWRPAAAIVGGLYFGMAGILHLFKKPESRNEVIALVSDFYIFLIVALYLSFTL